MTRGADELTLVAPADAAARGFTPGWTFYHAPAGFVCWLCGEDAEYVTICDGRRMHWCERHAREV